MASAEENCAWVRSKIKERGWAEEIEAKAEFVFEARTEIENMDDDLVCMGCGSEVTELYWDAETEVYLCVNREECVAMMQAEIMIKRAWRA